MHQVHKTHKTPLKSSPTRNRLKHEHKQQKPSNNHPHSTTIERPISRRNSPRETLTTGMDALDVIRIEPETTHVGKRPFPDDGKELPVHIRDAPGRCIVRLPPVHWSHTVLLQRKILTPIPTKRTPPN